MTNTTLCKGTWLLLQKLHSLFTVTSHCITLAIIMIWDVLLAKLASLFSLVPVSLSVCFIDRLCHHIWTKTFLFSTVRKLHNRKSETKGIDPYSRECNKSTFKNRLPCCFHQALHSTINLSTLFSFLLANTTAIVFCPLHPVPSYYLHDCEPVHSPACSSILGSSYCWILFIFFQLFTHDCPSILQNSPRNILWVSQFVQ